MPSGFTPRIVISVGNKVNLQFRTYGDYIEINKMDETFTVKLTKEQTIELAYKLLSASCDVEE